jgi:hypothetical protein
MGTIEKIVVDDATLTRLQQDARLNGRSLEEEAAERLRQSSPGPSRAEIIARLDAVAAMTPEGIRQTDSTLLIREDRDR